MPTTVPALIERTAANAAAHGMRYALDEKIRKLVRPGGFAFGFTILGMGLAARARRRHLQRIEEKVDLLIEDEPDRESREREVDQAAAAREERRERRHARRG